MLQVLLSALATLLEHFVKVPPLVAQAQLLADVHDSLGYCGWDKLLSTLLRVLLMAKHGCRHGQLHQKLLGLPIEEATCATQERAMLYG